MRNNMAIALLLAAAGAASADPAGADEATYKYRITSLFQADRVDDFRALIQADFPEITVEDVDFDTAVATLRFDFKKLKPLSNAKSPEEIRDKLNFVIRGASRGTFLTLAPSSVPADQLGEAVIPVQGLDCKGCSYGAYLAVARVDGVEYATASFRTGEVRVRYDRRKTSLVALEEALNARSIPTNYTIDDPRAVPRGEMKIVRRSSEETSRDVAYFHATSHAAHVLDGDPLTKWSSRYTGDEKPEHPHELVIDLGKTRNVVGFRYLPRQLGSMGQFADTEFYVSDDPAAFPGKPAVAVTFTSAKSAQAADCPRPVAGRYVLIRVLSEIRGRPIASAAEIAVLQMP